MGTGSREENASNKRLRADEGNEILKACAGAIRRDAELFEQRRVGAIDPERRIAKPLGARRIPAGKRGEQDFLLGHAERIDAHLVGARIRLVDALTISVLRFNLENSFET